MWLRTRLNAWRRTLWRLLFQRMLFGERGADGAVLAHTRIAPSTCIESESNLQLADHVFIGQFNFIDASGGVRIDEGVQITNFVSIISHSSHRAIRLLGRAYVDQQATPPGYIKAPVTIGAYTFIGPHSLIEAGSRIGKGVVVCSHSAVRGEVADFAIVAGRPAQVIGDVRARDARLLQQYPELAAHYQAWAGELPVAPDESN